MRLGPQIDYLAIGPPLAAAVTALVVLVADLFAGPGRRRVLLPGLSLAGVAVALGVAGRLAAGSPRRTFCQPGPSCSYVADDFTVLFQLLLLVAAAAVLLLSASYVSRERLPGGEYHFLLLSSLAGMLTLAASRDLVLLLLSLEVVSVPTFVLAGLRRADPRSAEAALKFFLVSVLATAVMLLGMALLYGVTGSVQLDRIAAALAEPAADLPVTSAAVVLLIAGFGFKVGAVPFHAWAPDTYQGAPLPVAVFLAVASKAAGFAGLLVVVLAGLRPYAGTWGAALAVLATASIVLGNLVALQQSSAVRLLAWSGVAQTGYMLVPLAARHPAPGELPGAVAATVGYLAIYVGMELGAFACVLAVGRHAPGNRLEDYRGLARRAPLLAAALALFLLCLAGLPPGFAGLFAKVVVFRAALDAGLGWLAVVMAVGTVVGLAYYARLAALLFAPPAEDAAYEGRLVVSRPVAVVIAVAAAALVAVGFAPQLALGLAPGLPGG